MRGELEIDSPVGRVFTVRWKGSEGSKQTKRTTQKNDALLIPEFFFVIYRRPFFGNVGFIKFGTFSALLALPVMIREEYGHIAYQTLPSICSVTLAWLRSRASLGLSMTTHLTRAR